MSVKKLDRAIQPLSIGPSEVTQIVPKCSEIDNQINLISEAYHLVYGGPKNLLNDSSNLAEIKTPMKNTLLHIAALHGNDDIVTHIVKHAPKLLFTLNNNNDSVLHVAARGGHISTVKKLLASYANFKQKDIALAWLEYTGYEDDDLEDYNEEENMKDLLYFVTKKNIQGNTMLHEAMLCGADKNKKSIDTDNNIFKVFEEYETKNQFGNSLSKFCYEYALDIVNHAKKSVLYIAVENGDVDAVKLILRQCPKNDAKPEGLSPVVTAIMKRHKDMLRILLESNPTWIHLSDKDERLPLHYAASIGYLEGVELLLNKCKCCTIHRDKYGYFPIHLASYGGHVQVVKKLLEYCPNSTDMVDAQGQNILHIASNYGKFEVVHYILQSQNREYHKMINQQDKGGNTPLHLAALSCNPKVVYYLVNHQRVNLDLLNDNDQTALDMVYLLNEDDGSTLRQYLTKIALISAGVNESFTKAIVWSNESKQSDSNSSKDQTESVEKTMTSFMEKISATYKDKVQTLLLVSTLIVTASVAACFAVPGEANGKANNLCHTMFQVFIIFITISLFSAICSTILLLWETLGLIELMEFSVKIVINLLGIALMSLSLAFMAGLYTVISELTWLANVFLVINVTFVVLIISLYMLFFIPSPSTRMCLRYISHYPYLFLASIC